ncbi:MAG: hypothetical protein V3T88_08705 [Nitrosomonadaceae bacterium]
MEEKFTGDPIDQATEVVAEELKTDVALPAEQIAHADNAADLNLAKMREAKEKVEQEKLELQQRLLQYEQLSSKPKEEEATYRDDDFIEGKHLKKEMDSVKKQLKAYESQAKEAADETKLKSRYSDFDKVVTNETIVKLKEEDPEFAETIALSQSSLYARGTSTYKRIKELGIYVEDKHEADRAKAQENAAKPKPMNSISPQTGDSALSMANAFANGLTPDLKKQLWKEMQDASKRH